MWLVGLMASGKSTAGRLAAASLSVDFYDTDAMVEELAGMSVAQIWEREGEESFRSFEREIIAAIPSDPSLVATGGGAVLDPANRAVMGSRPPVVWLRARPTTLAARVRDGGGRPLLADSRNILDRFEEMAAVRDPVYSQLATQVIDTDDLEPENIASILVGLWPN